MNINISVSSTAKENGRKAAEQIAKLINAAIAKKGYARIVLSTGASQFEMFDVLVKLDFAKGDAGLWRGETACRNHTASSGNPGPSAQGPPRLEASLSHHFHSS